MEIPIGFAQVTLIFGGTNYPTGAAITFGVDNQGTASAADVAALAGDIYRDEVMPDIENGTTLLLSRAKLGPQSSGAMAEEAYNVDGGDDKSALVCNTAILVQKVTALGGREGRGRMYVPGLSEEVVNGVGGIAVAKLNDLQAAFNSMWTELDTATIPMVLLHNSETLPTPVSSLVVSPTVATQRRRLRR